MTVNSNKYTHHFEYGSPKIQYKGGNQQLAHGGTTDNFERLSGDAGDSDSDMAYRFSKNRIDDDNKSSSGYNQFKNTNTYKNFDNIIG